MATVEASKGRGGHPRVTALFGADPDQQKP